MITILLAEDDADIRNLFIKILSRRGYDVLEATNGEEALMIYENSSQKPDLIVIDYRMPKMNGIELTKELLSRNPQCNILFMYGDPRIERKLKPHDNVKLKTKPINTADLLKTISEMIKA
jgi:CheY-like chemotaxis protein